MVLFVHLGGLFNAIVYLRQHGYFSQRQQPLTHEMTNASNTTLAGTNSFFAHPVYSGTGFDAYNGYSNPTPPIRNRPSNAEIVERIQTSDYVTADASSIEEVKTELDLSACELGEGFIETELEPITPYGSV